MHRSPPTLVWQRLRDDFGEGSGTERKALSLPHCVTAFRLGPALPGSAPVLWSAAFSFDKHISKCS